MEERHEPACFFFRDPAQGFGQLTGHVRQRFNGLFEGSGGGERDTFAESTYQAIVGAAETRFLIGTRIRIEFGVDPDRINYYEYYLLLEQIDRMDRKRKDG